MYKAVLLFFCLFVFVLPTNAITTSGDGVILMEEGSGRVYMVKYT